MRTIFTPEQLADPDLSSANDILRSCVHCGFCTATCPTFVLLGDELDSPRGRIYLIKNMLEDRARNTERVTEKVVKHVDRCLSCLSCMTTCPSGVHYMHLVDQGRARIEESFVRPRPERMLRALLAAVLPRPGVFRLALIGAWLVKPFAFLMPGRLKGMVKMAPARIPAPSSMDRPQVFAAKGPKRKRIVLMNGCAQQVLRPTINEATVRLLTRHGCEVVVAEGGGCCGALVHHMGREADALKAARANIAAWERVAGNGGLDAVVINASGCGTTVKDYGYMLRKDPDWAARAARMASLAKDITEVVAELGLKAPVSRDRPAVAYHSACSLQHGQQIREEPKKLLLDAGFEVFEPAEGHLCCGSAGTYNLMQPELAGRLQKRKAAHLEATGASVIATGNIGCLVQIGDATGMPVVHTVELLDWATGGPRPSGMV
ncbi:MAG: glycolate oxidase subunit GlcF [Rhodospirillales bacterium]|nr:glycolate oxidase subunit GlcF [Rhodospirillales bacterium]